MTSATKPPSNAQARWTTHVPPYSRLIRNKHNKALTRVGGTYSITHALTRNTPNSQKKDPQHTQQ
jgi:hypothetical protein